MTTPASSVPEEAHVTRDTIETFGAYTHEPPGDEDGYGVSLWAYHRGSVEYPIIMQSRGLTLFASADSNFGHDERNELSDEFYEQLGVHTTRIFNGEDYAIHDFWAWLPDELPGYEGQLLFEVLRHAKEYRLTFEIQELYERAMLAVGEHMDLDDFEDFEFEISDDAFEPPEE